MIAQDNDNTLTVIVTEVVPRMSGFREVPSSSPWSTSSSGLIMAKYTVVGLAGNLNKVIGLFRRHVNNIKNVVILAQPYLLL